MRPFLLLLAVLVLAPACRSTAPPEPPPPPPMAPAVPVESPDPVVTETRRVEEEIESPAGGWQRTSLTQAPPIARTPATVELEFAPGGTALTAPSRRRLEALAAHLLRAGGQSELELVATPEDGSGSELERRLLRRRLEVVSERLRAAGRSVLLVEEIVWHADGAEGAALAPRRVFVVVRAP